MQQELLPTPKTAELDSIQREKDEQKAMMLSAEAVQLNWQGEIGRELSRSPLFSPSRITADGARADFDEVEKIMRVQQEAEQNNLKIVVIELNTPGGIVNEIQAIIDVVRSFKQQYPDIKIIVHSKDNYSGGLFISSICDDVFSFPEGGIGSLGTVSGYVKPFDTGPLEIIASTSGKRQTPEVRRQRIMAHNTAQHRDFQETVMAFLQRHNSDLPSMETIRSVRASIQDEERKAEIFSTQIVDKLGLFTAALEVRKCSGLEEFPIFEVEIPEELKGYKTLVAYVAKLVRDINNRQTSRDELVQETIAYECMTAVEADLFAQLPNQMQILYRLFWHSENFSGRDDLNEAQSIGLIGGVKDRKEFNRYLEDAYGIEAGKIVSIIPAANSGIKLPFSDSHELSAAAAMLTDPMMAMRSEANDNALSHGMPHVA